MLLWINNDMQSSNTDQCRSIKVDVIISTYSWYIISVYLLCFQYFATRLVHIAHRDALVADYVLICLSGFLPAIEIRVTFLNLTELLFSRHLLLYGERKPSNSVAFSVLSTTSYTSLVVAVSSLRHKEHLTRIYVYARTHTHTTKSIWPWGWIRAIQRETG